jgi:hypothetical protein
MKDEGWRMKKTGRQKERKGGRGGSEGRETAE